MQQTQKVMVTHKTSTLFLSTCTRSFTNFVQSRCHTYRLAGSTYQSGLDSTTSMRLQGTMAATNASPHLPRSPCLTVMNQGLEESLNPSGSSILLPISVVVFFLLLENSAFLHSRTLFFQPMSSCFSWHFHTCISTCFIHISLSISATNP